MEDRKLQAVCKRINQAVAYLVNDDAEAALTPLLLAIDAASGDGRAAYKSWLAARMRIVSLCFYRLGWSFAKVNLPHLPINPRMKNPDEHGTIPFEELIYHLIRCGLVHDCALPEQIQDNKTAAYRYDPESGTMYLSYRNLARGLLMALLMDIPKDLSGSIQGNIAGYPLTKLCGLPEADMMAMVRCLWKAKIPDPAPSIVFAKTTPSTASM